MPLTLLAAAAEALGHPLTPSQLETFERFRVVLLDWNTKINVTAIREAEAVETLHFIDALAALPLIPPGAMRVVDIGSGGGLPGLALRIARPELHLTLVDSINKKVKVMTEIATALGLMGTPTDGGAPVIAVAARAEELGQSDGTRGTYDVALARAVGPTNVVVELTLPLVRVGGRAILWKKRGIEDELREAAGAISTLGGKLGRLLPADLPGLPPDRQLVEIAKSGPTPRKYPRSPGTPSKDPLRTV